MPKSGDLNRPRCFHRVYAEATKLSKTLNQLTPIKFASDYGRSIRCNHMGRYWGLFIKQVHNATITLNYIGEEKIKFNIQTEK